MARSSRRPRTKVTFVQLLTALCLFMVLSVMGGFLLAGIALPAATVAGSAAEGTADLFEELPKELSSVELPQQSNIYDRTGKNLLATFYSQNRVVVPLEEISPWLQAAVVSVEDKRFYEHHGVDGEGILAAAYKNFTQDASAGASTLTQQLVKNTLLQKALEADDDDAVEAATEVSINRKIREWRLALAYEENVDKEYGTDCDPEDPAVDCGKDQVLEQYLNIAQFGPNIYGAEAAAQYYFSKSAKDLNALEAATIAGITQNPSKWDPVRYPENAKQRRDTVLLTMYQHPNQYITEEQLDEYTTTPVEETLKVTKPKFSCVAAKDAPFFCDYVTKIIKTDEAFNSEDSDLTGADLLYQGGLDIVTTLDLKKQRIANQELRASLPADDPSGWATALVSLDPSTGQILAMAQNKDFDPAADTLETTAINYAVDRKYGGSRGFSPGSTFKPIILTEWLKSGHSLLQNVSGAQVAYQPDDWTASCLGDNVTFGNEEWKPGNVENAFTSNQTVLKATANSVNTAYVAMMNQLDLCDVADTAADLGFHRADGADFELLPSVALGTQNASPLTMAQVAQVYANDGVRCDPLAILAVTDADGHALAVPEQNCERVIEKDIAVGVTYAMQEVMKTGSGQYSQLEGGRPAAGKTGTATQNTHTWFMGFTPDLVTTIWIGNPNHDEPGQWIKLNGVTYDYLYGSSLAAPTWKRYMDRALEGTEFSSFEEPVDDVLHGKPVDVPDLTGLSESDARKTAAAAGFQLSASPNMAYSTRWAPGTVIAQSPSSYGQALPGTVIYYTIATDTLPSWFTNWPDGWDPAVAPEDWWGSEWPPAQFETNPPAGWPEDEPSDEPSADSDDEDNDNDNGNRNGNGNGNRGRGDN